MEERFLKIYKCESCTFSSASDSIDNFGRYCYKLKRKVPLNFLIDADCPLPKELIGSGQNSAEKAQPEGEPNKQSESLLCEQCDESANCSGCLKYSKLCPKCTNGGA